MKYRKALGWLAAAAVVLAFIVWPDGRSGDGPEPMIATIERGLIENTVTAAGTMQPGLWVDVGAQVSGQLKNLVVDVGDDVQEGDLLAEIDASVQANRVEASRAGLQAEKAQRSARVAAVSLARSNLERQKELIDRELTSQTDLDAAINQLAAAESSLSELDSRVLSGTASLASDEAQLAYSRIYAPIMGTVVALATIEGQTLNAVQQVPTILRIADLSSMIVRADVSEADVGLLRVDMAAYFTTLGGGERRWYGTVDQILPTPNVVNNVVFYPVLFSVPNEDRALLPEMTAQVFFVVESADEVLKVPVGALQYADGLSDVATVQVVADDGAEQSREVSLGISDRIHREVRDGLAEGDKVIAGIRESEPNAK
ncbi:MAG: efflux RND transporter periplasmic adaptor subunit [Woeseiaceae bacterium]